MKKLLQSLSILGAFGSAALFAQAQPPPKVLVVDMVKLYEGHYRTVEENAKLQADSQKAQADLQALGKEQDALVAQYKDLAEQSNNPTATNEAKAKAQSDAQTKMQEAQAKHAELIKLRDTATQELQQRRQQFLQMMMEEISKIASDVAKREGASLLFDKSSASLLPSVIYADPSLDITSQVADEINKSRPVPTPATPAAAAPSAPTAPAGADQPPKS